MNPVLWTILLALAWNAVNGTFTAAQFVFGLALGFVVVVFVRAVPPGYVRRLVLLTRFLLFFVRELFAANIRVARDVLSPHPRIAPGVIAIPLDIRHPTAITVFANLLTLTPGTLSLDVSKDQRVLYVHGMYFADPAAAKAEIKQGFEARIKELLQ